MGRRTDDRAPAPRRGTSRFLLGFVTAWTLALVVQHGGAGSSAPGMAPGALPGMASGTATALDEVVELADRLAMTSLDAPGVRQRMMAGLLSGLDEHADYVAAEEADELLGPAEGKAAPAPTPSFGFLPTDWRGEFVVEVVFPGGPAERAGLRAGDRIVGLRGRNLEQASWEEVGRALGAELSSGAGRVVHLDVVNLLDAAAGKQARRRTLALHPEIFHHAMAIDLGLDREILHLHLPIFREGLSEDVAAAIRARQRTGAVKGVVLDLRDNRGGVAEEAVEVAGLFVPKGTMVYEMEGRGVGEDVFRTGREPIFPDLPVAVVINGNTASASEILSVALKAGAGATLVGWPSYGKDSVQRVFRLSGGDAVKFTIGHYRAADGAMIGKDGILPDIRVSGAPTAPRPPRFAPDPALSAATAALLGR